MNALNAWLGYPTFFARQARCDGRIESSASGAISIAEAAAAGYAVYAMTGDAQAAKYTIMACLLSRTMQYAASYNS